MKHHVKIVVLR